MSVLNLTFLCFSFALFLLFFPLSSECISSSPLLQFCLYPASQICITKVYHIRLAYGKGGILFWKVKGIREKKNRVDRNNILFVSQVRVRDCEDSHVNNSCHCQIWLRTHSRVVKDSISAHPEACRKWNTSTKQVKARRCHAFVSLLDENPKQFLPMNMHHVYVLAIIRGAQQMAGMFWDLLHTVPEYCDGGSRAGQKLSECITHRLGEWQFSITLGPRAKGQDLIENKR